MLAHEENKNVNNDDKQLQKHTLCVNTWRIYELEWMRNEWNITLFKAVCGMEIKLSVHSKQFLLQTHNGNTW